MFTHSEPTVEVPEEEAQQEPWYSGMGFANALGIAYLVVLAAVFISITL